MKRMGNIRKARGAQAIGKARAVKPKPAGFMGNICAIFKGDMRSLICNVTCAVVTLGLVLVPPLYAWLTSLGFWDPYNNTGGLKVAISNEDAGYTNSTSGLRLDAGSQIIAQIHENDQFDWVFEDREAAIGGVESGEYYAAIVIPEDFSAELMTAYNTPSGKAVIDYYSNEKANAIAPHVTSQGATQLQVQIDEAINKTVADVVLGTGDSLTSYLSGGAVNDYAERVVSLLDDDIDTLQQACATLDAFSTLLSGSDELASSTATLLEQLSEDCKNASNAIKQAQGDLTSEEALQKYEDALAKLPEDLRGEFPTAEELTKDVNAGAEKLDAFVAGLEQAAESMAGTSDTLSGELGSVSASLQSTAGSLRGAIDNMAQTRDKLQGVLDSGKASAIRGAIGNDPETLAAFLSAPTELVEHPVYKVDNNGSSMSPFYTSLSLWVGAVFLVALTSVTLPRKRLEQLDSPSPTQLYLGHYGVFGVVAIAQALIVGLGNVFFVGVQCENIGAYLLALVVAAVVFSMLAYTLTVSFGPIGKAIMVIGLVLQIGGAGGIFPVELSAPLFQDIYPWLPLTHSMAAFEGAMFGSYGMQYWAALAALGLYFAGSLVVGLVLRRPIVRLNDYVVRKLDETQVL